MFFLGLFEFMFRRSMRIVSLNCPSSGNSSVFIGGFCTRPPESSSEVSNPQPCAHTPATALWVYWRCVDFSGPKFYVHNVISVGSLFVSGYWILEQGILIPFYSYLHRTAAVRTGDSDPVFRSWISPFCGVYPQTRSRWLTSCIEVAG